MNKPTSKTQIRFGLNKIVSLVFLAYLGLFAVLISNTSADYYPRYIALGNYLPQWFAIADIFIAITSLSVALTFCEAFSTIYWLDSTVGIISLSFIDPSIHRIPPQSPVLGYIAVYALACSLYWCIWALFLRKYYPKRPTMLPQGKNDAGGREK